MSLKIGIIGLPNVGKSTLFNALVKGASAEAENYPFCTIDPNVGMIEVPDERLKKLAKISNSKKIMPAVVEFVDIAGLVKGASQGEGLGNKFLSHIRECDAIAMVVRFFEDKNIQHVSNKLNPNDDIKVIETELQLADLEIVSKRLDGIDSEIRGGSKTALREKKILASIKAALDEGKNARVIEVDEEDLLLIKSLSLLTLKPIIYVANVSEDQLKNADKMIDSAIPTPHVIPAQAGIQNDNIKFIPISAKIESELNALSEQDKKEYLESLDIKNSGRDQLIKEAYKILGLLTFFTSGEPETRAWTVRKGAKAPEAAGVIHTDFEYGFISADVIDWQKLVEVGGWSDARAKGMVRMEGRDYVAKDGDVMLFKFNV
ncbi:MAG: redox-regulated ATPase YchF [Patescibacteria group bacterium]|nr:redox-regulated ATPase YchF [Patescibacteria group bacterium]